ncbi:DUF6020 family protein [Wohlfahrtiimonas larvae]|uniref:Glycosyltransferase RgtA/B/C/D-like domain-containing protein n=1 Tax=Wohlfahrtiimonas larvae TaxID=1157986 RepID=A0ABP9MUM2_9GAMM|nr:DUF6020 family protein [Wohlfahrtiimonas larvae]
MIFFLKKLYGNAISVFLFILYVYLILSFAISYDFDITDLSIQAYVSIVIGALLTSCTPYIVKNTVKCDYKIIICSVVLGIFIGISTVPVGLTKFFEVQRLVISIIYFSIIVFYVINFLITPFERHKGSYSPLKASVILWGLLTIVWLSYFYAFYPGILNNDSYYQFAQAHALAPLGSHHPIFHTALIWLNIQISSNIAVYFGITIIIASSLVCYILYKFMKWGMPRIYIIVIILFYALYPINGLYLMTLWKDIPYSISLLWFSLVIYKIYRSQSEYLLSINNIITLMIVTLLVLNLRSNGIFVGIGTFIVLIILSSKYKLRLFIISMCIFGLHFSTHFYIKKKYHVLDTNFVEALAIPLQQVAGVYNGPRNIKNESVDTYFNVLLPSNNWKHYCPINVDFIKFNRHFNYQYLEEGGKFKFFKNWYRLWNEYPWEYIRAYFKQTSPLWLINRYRHEINQSCRNKTDEVRLRVGYINTVLETGDRWLYGLDYFKVKKDADLAYKKYQYVFLYPTNLTVPLTKDQYIEKVTKIKEGIYQHDIKNNILKPYYTYALQYVFDNASIFANGGIVTLVFLFVLSASIAKRQVIICVPLLINLLTLFISAPAPDFRYIFSVLFSLPIMLFINKIPNYREDIQ